MIIIFKIIIPVANRNISMSARSLPGCLSAGKAWWPLISGERFSSLPLTRDKHPIHPNPNTISSAYSSSATQAGYHNCQSVKVLICGGSECSQVVEPRKECWHLKTFSHQDGWLFKKSWAHIQFVSSNAFVSSYALVSSKPSKNETYFERSINTILFATVIKTKRMTMVIIILYNAGSTQGWRSEEILGLSQGRAGATALLTDQVEMKQSIIFC